MTLAVYLLRDISLATTADTTQTDLLCDQHFGVFSTTALQNAIPNPCELQCTYHKCMHKAMQVGEA
jgi:hypothetical protein